MFFPPSCDGWRGMEEPRASRGRASCGGGAGYGGGSRKPFEPESESEKAEIATTRTRGAPLWD